MSVGASPLRSLLARRVCNCGSSRPPFRSHLRQTSRNASSYASPVATYGSSEALKRRYQKAPESIQIKRAEHERIMKRIRYSALGILLCGACIFGTVYSGIIPEPEKKSKDVKAPPPSTRYDTPPSIAGLTPNTSISDSVEHIPTGTSTIPTFPRSIHLPATPAGSSSTPPVGPSSSEEEYILLGLGIRTVSFLRIQVYVVGLYVALADTAALQEALIRRIDPVATTLVPSEKAQLEVLLMDPATGEEIWNAILRDAHIRTAIRIVPTRNTDFMHLRDGWVRGITARTQALAASGRDASLMDDDSFGAAVNAFKAIWSGSGAGLRKSVPKGETLLLMRDGRGALAAWLEENAKKKAGADGQAGPSPPRLLLGGLADERISRLIWLGYLGGKNVSSESARRSVVDGCLEMTGRPVGTVEEMVE